MLWKKESKKKDALYVDIIAIAGSERLEEEFIISEFRAKQSKIGKNDSISLLKRKEGNEVFARGDWLRAMVLYSESLCFAPQRSMNISLAYANRSACFYHLKLFENCLKDIELAAKTGYPMDLMPKLDQRKFNCIMRIVKGESFKKIEMKLDFEADEKFPCMANVLCIERGEDNEYSVIAKEDIDIGKKIAVEKSFLCYLLERRGLKCNICLKGNANLMPCNKCPDAMFCSDECQNSIFHEIECSTNILHRIDEGVMLRIRGVLLAINLFPNVNKLMKFVEQIINSDAKTLATHLTDMKSQCQAFLKLPSKSDIDINGSIGAVYLIYQHLLKSPKLNIMFNSEKSRRFLMHLICHVLKGIRMGSAGIYLQVNLIEEYFEKSCMPNVVRIPHQGHDIYTTIRPIRKGESLQFSYAGDTLIESKLVRQRWLWHQMRKICVCSRCDGLTESSTQRRQLFSDPDFQYILSNFSEWDQIGNPILRIIEAKCMAFLKKFNHITWSEEIGRVLIVYTGILTCRSFQAELHI